MATGDILLQLAGVTGESSDSKHKDFIDVLSFSWDMSAPAVSTGGPKSKAKIEDFKIVKRADRSTPVLIQYLYKGIVVKTGRLLVRKAGGEDPLTYLEIEFKNLMVSGFSTQTKEMEVFETVTFSFESATFEYTPQSAAGAKGGGVVEYTVSAYGIGK